MADEKRMIENYEVKHAIHLSGGEVVLAEDASAAEPFMVCNCSWDNPFSLDVYSNIAVSADYLEVMKEFLNRVALRVELIEKERALRGVSNIPLTADDCIPGSWGWNYENRLIVIAPGKLTPTARTADHQLLLATGGNGCDLDARGTAVFCINLFTGKATRWERYHIAGVIRPDRMPEWAAEKLSALQKPAEKQSLLGKLEAAKKTAARDNPAPKEPKHRKPER